MVGYFWHLGINEAVKKINEVVRSGHTERNVVLKKSR